MAEMTDPIGKRFDRLLRAMASGEPHKAEKRQEPRSGKEAGSHSPPEDSDQ